MNRRLNREHLSRQRGAGARNLDPDFGFTFELESGPSTLPNTPRASQAKRKTREHATAQAIESHSTVQGSTSSNIFGAQTSPTFILLRKDAILIPGIPSTGRWEWTTFQAYPPKPTVLHPNLVIWSQVDGLLPLHRVAVSRCRGRAGEASGEEASGWTGFKRGVLRITAGSWMTVGGRVGAGGHQPLNMMMKGKTRNTSVDRRNDG